LRYVPVVLRCSGFHLDSLIVRVPSVLRFRCVGSLWVRCCGCRFRPVAFVARSPLRCRSDTVRLRLRSCCVLLFTVYVRCALPVCTWNSLVVLQWCVRCLDILLISGWIHTCSPLLPAVAIPLHSLYVRCVYGLGVALPLCHVTCVVRCSAVTFALPAVRLLRRLPFCTVLIRAFPAWLSFVVRYVAFAVRALLLCSFVRSLL